MITIHQLASSIEDLETAIRSTLVAAENAELDAATKDYVAGFDDLRDMFTKGESPPLRATTLTT